MITTQIIRVSGSPLASVQARPWVLQWWTSGGCRLWYYPTRAEAERAEAALLERQTH